LPGIVCVNAVNVVDVVFTGIVNGVVCIVNTEGAVDIASTAVATAIRSLLVVRTANVNEDDVVCDVPPTGPEIDIICHCDCAMSTGRFCVTKFGAVTIRRLLRAGPPSPAYPEFPPPASVSIAPVAAVI
jgi:hypothetical protein